MFRKMAEEKHVAVAPGTLGILLDPKHPAFARFPTESYANWQWFHLLTNSRALKLAGLPAQYRPLVQVVDNPERAQKLGALFEARVGTGKLLVCAIDLIGQKDSILHDETPQGHAKSFVPQPSGKQRRYCADRSHFPIDFPRSTFGSGGRTAGLAFSA